MVTAAGHPLIYGPVGPEHLPARTPIGFPYPVSNLLGNCISTTPIPGPIQPRIARNRDPEPAMNREIVNRNFECPYAATFSKNTQLKQFFTLQNSGDLRHPDFAIGLRYLPTRKIANTGPGREVTERTLSDPHRMDRMCKYTLSQNNQRKCLDRLRIPSHGYEQLEKPGNSVSPIRGGTWKYTLHLQV